MCKDSTEAANRMRSVNILDEIVVERTCLSRQFDPESLEKVVFGEWEKRRKIRLLQGAPALEATLAAPRQDPTGNLT